MKRILKKIFIWSGILCVFVFIFLCIADRNSVAVARFEDTVEYDLYIQKYTNPSLRIENGLSSYFIPFSYDSNNFYSEKMFKSLDGIQEWLDNNSNVEILSIIGPIIKNKVQGIEIIFRESEEKHEYCVYLSETNINYKGYVASYKFSVYTSGGDYHSGGCIIVTDKHKIFEDVGIIENNVTNIDVT